MHTSSIYPPKKRIDRDAITWKIQGDLRRFERGTPCIFQVVVSQSIRSILKPSSHSSQTVGDGSFAATACDLWERIKNYVADCPRSSPTIGDAVAGNKKVCFLRSSPTATCLKNLWEMSKSCFFLNKQRNNQLKFDRNHELYVKRGHFVPWRKISKHIGCHLRRSPMYENFQRLSCIRDWRLSAISVADRRWQFAMNEN
jgi:hypothetical protein